MVEEVNIRGELVVGSNNGHIRLLEQCDYLIEDGEIEIGMGFFCLGMKQAESQRQLDLIFH